MISVFKLNNQIFIISKNIKMRHHNFSCYILNIIKHFYGQFMQFH